MSTLAQQRTKSTSHFGGIFGPLAQYPGASYATILAEKIEQHTFVPRNTKREKTWVRSHAHDLKDMSKNTLPFNSALLLVDMESNASLDRTALRDAGIKFVRVLTSGVQAAKALSAANSNDLGEGGQIDIVFCHSRLEDMSAAQWIELIRKHPGLKNLPVVALVGGDVEREFLQSMDFTDLVTRPYSPKTLHDKLLHIQKIPNPWLDAQSPEFNAALHRFERCKTEEGKASFHVEEGLRFVQQKAWDSAIQEFNKALVHPAHKGDAELGLAAAWRGKQDLEKFRYYVYEAGLTFTRASQWTKARSAYVYMLRVLPKAPSPFVRTAQSYIRAGEYAKAATALVHGMELSSHENIANQVANACIYTENPAQALSKVKQVFVDPSLKNIVDSLDDNLAQALVAHQDAVSKGREERAKLEEKAKVFKAQQAKKHIPQLVSLEPEFDDDCINSGAKLTEYDEKGDESILEAIPGNPSLMQDDYVRKGKQENVLELMSEDDLESQLFTGFPKLNEAATVIKTTFKLMKK